MRTADAIRAASTQLEATSDTARLDAELLMAHALGVTRSDMLLRHMQDAAPVAFDSLIARRAAHEPVAYITGKQEFYGREFSVEPGALIPRPDSEVLIDTALELCPDPKRVLDLGTGSGALLFTILLERPKAQGVGIDASQQAIEIALDNGTGFDAAEHLMDDWEWKLHCRDWTTPGWAKDLGQFDLIVCNPPYVETSASLEPDVRDFEPASALFAGSEGLDDYRILIPQLRALMTDDAVAIFEIGYTQAQAVTQIAQDQGFSVELHHDLAGRPRCLVLT
ncbi:SAM-dependent methyltransferase [Erythrobacter longus]|uniref:Release factor glutamine methyltransferase n=1 Tax=Erythrobacter longus TaxID=1044 RepID=A0A074MAQ0_ERYLO|nr:peptide chain release factor N(5)-glutamine methyltransferase [Erythrobacter longus]KEO89835.1 SAM-dependent methyltransferase [Erythrobacter longus]